MGEALVAGLITAGWADPADLTVVEAMPARRSELKARFPDVAVDDAVPSGTTGVLVAVKPGDVEAACAAVSAVWGGQPSSDDDSAAQTERRMLSIAAGVPISRLESWLPGGTSVVRAMPNTPAQIAAGAAAIAGGSRAGEDDLEWAASILAAVGTVVRVPERLLDAVTGLSGSGPAYVFLVAEALIEAGVLAGLPRDVSQILALHTLLGAARLLVETGESPEALRAAVTSPGGTTAAGLQALEDRGVRAALLAAVVAATERSKEQGRQA